MPIDKQELISALAQLSPGERSALMASSGNARHQTPKLGPHIDAIPAAKIDVCLALLSKAINAATPKEQTALVAELRDECPELVAACEVNSSYRGKAIGHSLSVAALRLLSRKV